MDRRLTIALVVVLAGVSAFFFHRSSKNGDGFERSDSEHTGLQVSEESTGFLVTDVQGQRATVLFPDRPDLKLMPIPGLAPASIATVTSRSRELYFAVMRLDPTQIRVSTDALFDLERDGALKQSGATLDREGPITVDGLPGREIVAHTPEEPMRMRYVLDRTHGLSYTALGGAIGGDSDDLAAAQSFIETLHVPH